MAVVLEQLLAMRLRRVSPSTKSPFSLRNSNVRCRIMSWTSRQTVVVMSTCGAASTGAHWKKSVKPAASRRLKSVVAGKVA